MTNLEFIDSNNSQKFIFDRSVVDVLAYVNHFKISDKLKIFIEDVYCEPKLINLSHDCLVLILQPLPLVDDGFRFADKQLQIDIHNEIVALYKKMRIPHIITDQKTAEKIVKFNFGG